MDRWVYVDNNATTRVDQRVIDALIPYFCGRFGNPSSAHFPGRCARQTIEAGRKYIGEMLGSTWERQKHQEIFFTSGGTESDNLAIIGYALANKEKGNHIITSAIEHPAVYEACRYLSKIGFRITYADVNNNGVVNVDKLQEAICNETILVSIMHANNETGSIQPLQAIGKICKEKKICFHTDAVQSFGKISIDVKKLGINMLSASSHKIYGPKGCGILYKDRDIQITPRVFGGHQEIGVRVGTENVTGIVGMSEAFRVANEMMEEDEKRIRLMRDRFEKLLKEQIPDIIINSENADRLGGTSNVGFRGIEGEALLLSLDMGGVYASTGSACTTGSEEPSSTLKAMGVTNDYINGCVRFSFGRFNMADDPEKIMEVLVPAVERLRKLSPLY